MILDPIMCKNVILDPIMSQNVASNPIITLTITIIMNALETCPIQIMIQCMQVSLQIVIYLVHSLFFIHIHRGNAIDVDKHI